MIACSDGGELLVYFTARHLSGGLRGRHVAGMRTPRCRWRGLTQRCGELLLFGEAGRCDLDTRTRDPRKAPRPAPQEPVGPIVMHTAAISPRLLGRAANGLWSGRLPASKIGPLGAKRG